MNYQDRQKQITEQFEQIKKEMEKLQRALNERQLELYRLQGEFRLLEKLKKEELENKKDKK